LTRPVRVANARLKVVAFSAICKGLVRVAGKGFTGKRFKVEGLKLKGRREKRRAARRINGWRVTNSERKKRITQRRVGHRGLAEKKGTLGGAGQSSRAVVPRF